jgi:hypothetical protein
MDKTLFQFLNSEFHLTPIKGKFSPIQFQKEIMEIHKIYTFPSEKGTLPFIIFDLNKQVYIGITLARCSSDLLVALAKKTIGFVKSKQEQKNSIFEISLMQYMFPKDFSSNRLIAFSILAVDNIIQKEEFQKKIQFLQELQKNLVVRIDHLVSLVGDKE